MWKHFGLLGSTRRQWRRPSSATKLSKRLSRRGQIPYRTSFWLSQRKLRCWRADWINGHLWMRVYYTESACITLKSELEFSFWNSNMSGASQPFPAMCAIATGDYVLLFGHPQDTTLSQSNYLGHCRRSPSPLLVQWNQGEDGVLGKEPDSNTNTSTSIKK